MTTIIGYGEDALTYWALTHKLEKILVDLGDHPRPEDCMIFYRPSFGRGGRSGASFGEFDAILSTKVATYLIESKWDGSSEATSKGVSLTKTQERRHKVFHWYLQNLKTGDKWSDFMKANQEAFQKEFKQKRIPTDRSELAKNIQFIAKNILKPDKVVDVLLLICKNPDAYRGLSVNPSTFRLVPLLYEPLDKTSHFLME